MRKHDWQKQLSDYLYSVQSHSFSYATFDCGRFSSGSIESITGVNPFTDHSLKYITRKEAMKQLKAICGSSSLIAFAEYCGVKYGWTEVHPNFAQRGDLICIDDGQLGIVGFDGWIVTTGSDGLVKQEIRSAKKAYRIT